MPEPIDINHLNTIANRRGMATVEHPSTTEVDAVGSELATYYNNPKYRGWYCKVVYTLGTAKTMELKARAEWGKDPARLFGYLASEMMKKASDER